MRLFSQLYNTVMALDYHHNLVSTQSLENELMELDQTLQLHCCKPNLGWVCYASIFATIQHSYGSWLLSKFRFRSIFHEQIAGI